VGRIAELPTPPGPPSVRRRGGWIASVVALIALVAFTIAVSLVFWPGHMNLDSIGELNDATTGHYTDWHSAMWSALWHVAIQLGLRSPGWMMAACALTLLVGLYLLLRVRLSRPLAVLGAAAVFIFPPVLSFDIEIGTDAWFTAMILCGFGFAACCARTQGWSRAASALLALTFACLAEASRPTAAPAVLTLLFALTLVLLAPRLGGWRRLIGAAGLGIVGTALIAGSLLTVQRQVLHAWEAHPEQTTYEYDLIALSIKEQTVLLPREVYPRQDVAYLAQYAGSASVIDISPLYWGDHAAIPPIVGGRALNVLQHSWLTAILDHPYDYLRFRLHTALWHLTIRAPASGVYYTGPADAMGYTFTMPHPTLHRLVMNYAAIGTTGLATGGPLQTVWVYVLLLLLVPVVAALAWRRGRRPADAVLALVSVALLLYTLEILFLAPGVTYRYMYPAVTTATVLFLLLAADAVAWSWARLRRSPA
jgi:hypothetical protein